MYARAFTKDKSDELFAPVPKVPDFAVDVVKYQEECMDNPKVKMLAGEK